MPENSTPGIDVEENPFARQFIVPAPTAVTAFVGRTRRGPLNEPVTVHSFAEFQRVFGGLWGHSPLSHALRQYFDFGGETAVVVRVTNGGHGCSLTLPGQGGALALRAANPGAREALRVSVDYDNIDSADTDVFNLVIQRVRGIGSELVAQQETYREVSVRPESERFVTDVLADSRLARVTGAVPSLRPDRTLSDTAGSPVAYVNANPDGSDGDPLTDYDVIGSEVDCTGIFALKNAPFFNHLHIPRLSPTTDVGPLTLLVAARFCKTRRCFLLVDPPQEWQSVNDALAGVRELNLSSENAVMYFPWLTHTDPEEDVSINIPPSAAIAGATARELARRPLWDPVPEGDRLLRPNFKPALSLSRTDARRLQDIGINPVIKTCRAVHEDLPPRTLAGPDGAYADWRFLGIRRLALHILESVERGTRWVVFEKNRDRTRHQVCRQIRSFLEELYRRGAFRGREPEESYFVMCDRNNNTELDASAGRLNILLGFATTRPGDFQVFSICHRLSGSRVTQCSLTGRIALAG